MHEIQLFLFYGLNLENILIRLQDYRSTHIDLRFKSFIVLFAASISLHLGLKAISPWFDGHRIFEYVLDIKKLFLVVSMADIGGSIDAVQSLMFV